MDMAEETGATWLVISDIALERNVYPSVGDVWSDEAEREWLERSPVVAHEKDKRLIRLRSAERVSSAVQITHAPSR